MKKVLTILLVIILCAAMGTVMYGIGSTLVSKIQNPYVSNSNAESSFFTEAEGEYVLEYEILADGVLADIIVTMVGIYCDDSIIATFNEDGCTLVYKISNGLAGLYLVDGEELIEWEAGEDDGVNVTYTLVVDTETAIGDMYLQSSVAAMGMTINYGMRLIEPTAETSEEVTDSVSETI